MSKRLTPTERSSVNRFRASTMAGELMRVGARRNRSSGDTRLPSLTTSSASNRLCCSALESAARTRHSREAARSRTRAISPIAHPSNQPCQDGHSGQENLTFDQPSRSQIKQHRWPFGAEPGAGVKPAQQPEAFELVVEIAVAKTALNFAGMLTMRGRPAQVTLQRGWIGNG